MPRSIATIALFAVLLGGCWDDQLIGVSGVATTPASPEPRPIRDGLASAASRLIINWVPADANTTYAVEVLNPPTTVGEHPFVGALGFCDPELIDVGRCRNFSFPSETVTGVISVVRYDESCGDQCAADVDLRVDLADDKGTFGASLELRGRHIVGRI